MAKRRFQEYEMFKLQATSIMSEAKMDLCNWEHTEFPNVCEISHESDSTKILGINWNKVMDTLCCVETIELTDDEISDSLTKRSVLSFISRIFDPVGMLCPAVLPMKVILQEAWATNLSWDATLPVEHTTRIRKWQRELNDLSRVQIPRFLGNDSNRELHTFCDASGDAYAAVSFLRTTTPEGNVKLTFVMAKSRVAPLKRPTIPRMELLACVIGARMARYVMDELHLSNQQSVIWSDSTTAIAWITRNNQWGTFVGNRVKEICQLTDEMSWRHVPGVNNPADLPSRGCSPSQLAQSKWWEGPCWLYSEPEIWASVDCNTDEDAIAGEMKKSVTNVTNTANNTSDQTETYQPWYLRSSNYYRSIRIISWVLWFINNCKSKEKTSGNVTTDEFSCAEGTVCKLVQQESFPSNADIKGMLVEKNAAGLYLVRTKLLYKSDDTSNFRLPILIPSDHHMTRSLIRWYHEKTIMLVFNL